MAKLQGLSVSADTSFADVYKADDVSMLKHSGGPEATKEIIALALKNVYDFFGAKWTQGQFMDCVTNFYDNCYYFTFSELKHFTRKAKGMMLGDGKLYGVFSPSTLNQWVQEYVCQAFDERTKHFSNKERKGWTPPENPVSDEKVAEALQDFAQTILTAKDQQRWEIDDGIAKAKAEVLRHKITLLNQAFLAGKITEQEKAEQLEYLTQKK